MSKEYTPFRFYRLCPEDSHTCVDRACLAGSPECPKKKKEEAVSPQMKPDSYCCVKAGER